MYANRGGVSEMKKTPLVTAVVTTYNRPQLVQRAIKSVLSQTYEPLEIILVEDGSDSGVGAWLQEERLEHIHYICHEENRGLAAARNTGLKLSHGTYIAYLDDDDEEPPMPVGLGELGAPLEAFAAFLRIVPPDSCSNVWSKAAWLLPGRSGRQCRDR